MCLICAIVPKLSFVPCLPIAHLYLNIHLHFMLLCTDRIAHVIFQGLQRRATPHPSELKVMKKGIEERRNEQFTTKPDSGSASDEVIAGSQQICSK